MSSRKRSDWSRRLPRPLVIPKVMTIATLADVCELMRHLPEGHRERSTWRVVAGDLEAAARGADPAGVALFAAARADARARAVPARLFAAAVVFLI